MPQKTWAIGEETLAADFNNYVQNQVVAQFPNTAARDTWSAPPNGALCVTVDTNTVWQRIAGVWVNRFALSTLAGALPASPVDGQIWYYPLNPALAGPVIAGGVVWVFRYNAGSSSAYKWEFVGGPSACVQALGSGGLAANANVWTNCVDVQGPLLYVPFAGDYEVRYGCQMTVGDGTIQYMSAGICFADSGPQGLSIGEYNSGSSTGLALAAGGLQPNVPNGTQVKMRYLCSSATAFATASVRWMQIHPVRVG